MTGRPSAVLGAGLVLLCVTADPRPAAPLPHVAEWVLLAATVVPLAVGLVGFRLTGRSSAVILAGAAGLGWTGVALASRGALGPPDRLGACWPTPWSGRSWCRACSAPRSSRSRCSAAA